MSEVFHVTFVGPDRGVVECQPVVVEAQPVPIPEIVTRYEDAVREGRMLRSVGGHFKAIETAEKIMDEMAAEPDFGEACLVLRALVGHEARAMRSVASLIGSEFVTRTEPPAFDARAVAAVLDPLLDDRDGVVGTNAEINFFARHAPQYLAIGPGEMPPEPDPVPSSVAPVLQLFPETLQ